MFKTADIKRMKMKPVMESKRRGKLAENADKPENQKEDALFEWILLKSFGPQEIVENTPLFLTVFYFYAHNIIDRSQIALKRRRREE